MLASGERESPGAASGASLGLLHEMLEATGLDLSPTTLFVSDLGPGSFIGARVCVTLAKTLAYASEKPSSGADAFDLISPVQTVAIPSRKGEYFVRVPGNEPVRTAELPREVVGYGAAFETPMMPHAKRFAVLLPKLRPTEPELLLPEYLLEPSISVPKKPYGLEGRVG